MNTSFQNRTQEKKLCCENIEKFKLFNIFGETGIGKSRLIEEIIKCLRNKAPAPIFLLVDFQKLKDYANPEQQFLESLIDLSEGRLTDWMPDQPNAADEIANRLLQISIKNPVYLMVDTTEIFQENMDFWAWLETHFVSPFVLEGNLQMVFAGRVPVPWRRFEVRRAVKQIPLEPLNPQNDAADLVKEVLEQENSKLTPEETEGAKNLVLEFSFGHPKLSEELARTVANQWPPSSLKTFRLDLCKNNLEPFINNGFFETVESDDWKAILWWASVLDWFDSTILPSYLKLAAPELIGDKTDFDFIQGITRLRIKDRVVWPIDKGERLHGVTGNIVRNCLKTMDPERYIKACQAASETFANLAEDFPEGYEERGEYTLEAEKYAKRAKMEVTL